MQCVILVCERRKSVLCSPSTDWFIVSEREDLSNFVLRFLLSLYGDSMRRRIVLGVENNEKTVICADFSRASNSVIKKD